MTSSSRTRHDSIALYQQLNVALASHLNNSLRRTVGRVVVLMTRLLDIETVKKYILKYLQIWYKIQSQP